MLHLVFLVSSRLRNLENNTNTTVNNTRYPHFNVSRISEIRNSIASNSLSCPNSGFLTFRAWDDDLDAPSKFFCDAFTTQITALPSNYSLQVTPWSATYWPLEMGGISYRYGENTSYADTWNASVNSYHQPQEHNLYYNTTQWDYVVNKVYSAAEKFDLLVGDLNYTLTNAMKDEGKAYAVDGDFASWMGYCHGWTPASINEPRPVKTVNLTAADGKTVISFYPEDVRAYATVYWANARFDTSFLGSRCDSESDLNNPSYKDNSTGLWDEYHCFSLNPASLLIVLGNQLGIRGKSFIYDRGVTGQVWNQPVVGYEISYYNPLTTGYHAAGEFNTSKVNISTFQQNANSSEYVAFFAKKANPNTKEVVGVNLNINYIGENAPVFGDRVVPDRISPASYNFIIELDDNENIIGGEWATTKAHPMFLWNMAQGGSPFGAGDDVVKTFGGSVQELQNMTAAAQKVSKRNTVLGAVMRYLVQESSNPTNTTNTTNSTNTTNTTNTTISNVTYLSYLE